MVKARVVLGSRSPQEIHTALEKEMEAERWKGLDRVLQAAHDDGAASSIYGQEPAAKTPSFAF